MDVRNAANEKLGDIQDVVLEQETGMIAYAALSFGGFLGMGDKLFAVPWAALKPTADRKAFTLDIPKERLQKAPGFDKKNWPDLNEPPVGHRRPRLLRRQAVLGSARRSRRFRRRHRGARLPYAQL